jgi:Lon protease-like protein
VAEGENEDLRIPVMPVTHTVLFPGAVIPLVVFEERYLELVDSVCRAGDLQFGLVFAPAGENFELSLPPSRIGTLVRILQHRRSPKGEVSLMVQGLARLRIGRLVWEHPFPLADARLVPPEADDPDPALRGRVLAALNEYLDHCAGDIQNLRGSLAEVESLGRLADIGLACVPAPPPERQKLLETLDPRARAEGLMALLQRYVKERGEAARRRPRPDGEASRN